ncbi:MAG TPA: MarR family winged helix-turn-helix transcriptional regulator [Opitutaceae bacterium]|nr:MarR family winged helix-turn-helix transcriptional regulator [Opitutaceae bacterium]
MPSGRGPLTRNEYEALAAFRHALRRFLAFSARAARAAGLSPQQHQALLAVKGAGGRPTIGALAAQLERRHHSAVGLVDRLARRGLARRERSAADRREVRVVLTVRGERLLAGLSAAHRDELRRVGPALRALLVRLHRR